MVRSVTMKTGHLCVHADQTDTSETMRRNQGLCLLTGLPCVSLPSALAVLGAGTRHAAVACLRGPGFRLGHGLHRIRNRFSVNRIQPVRFTYAHRISLILLRGSSFGPARRSKSHFDIFKEQPDLHTLAHWLATEQTRTSTAFLAGPVGGKIERVSCFITAGREERHYRNPEQTARDTQVEAARPGQVDSHVGSPAGSASADAE
ncbi:hypothetical protein RRG08_016221 [Elysia crispata]|uniref:Uncharacterized protein n=1 Tax=Elysia crispata TaxID=231223 RepID=A0AAE0ZPW5_9GAST|nr:hypothetical protein RRG08_016221 [Elysia crispata]